MHFSAPNSRSQSVPTQIIDQQRSPTPLPIIEEALELLKHEEDGNIFSWLQLSRSLIPKSQCLYYLPRLTPAQVHAIELLRNRDIGEVFHLMYRVRTASRSNQASSAGQ